MPTLPTAPSSQRFIDAWRRLAVKRGVSLGALAGSRGDEFAAVVAAAALAIPCDAPSSEREVNERLRAWLAVPGAMLATDHVELRRWLVDLRLVERDGYGREYRRADPPPSAYADAVVALGVADPAALAAQAREADASARAARRASHEARTGGRP
jgi:hypothetical protein